MIDATIAPMKPYRPGIEARRAILQELRRRELADEPAPSIRALALSACLSRRQIDRYLEEMTDAGLLTMVRRMGRGGAVVGLTDAGRLSADIAQVSPYQFRRGA